MSGVFDLKFDEEGNEIGDKKNYWRIALTKALEWATDDDYDDFMTTLGEQATKSEEQILLLKGNFSLDEISNDMFKSLVPLSLRLHQHYDIINYCFPHIVQILYRLYLLPYPPIRRWKESIENEWNEIKGVEPTNDSAKKYFIYTAVSHKLSSSKKIRSLLEAIADQIAAVEEEELSEEEEHEMTEEDSSSSSDSDSDSDSEKSNSSSSSDSDSQEDSSSN